MEKIGIGRPSTYSNIIETIIERKYAEKKDTKGLKVDIYIYILEKNEIKNKKENIVTGSEKKKLIPTDLGINKTTFLENNFSQILDYNFTSNLEGKLDEIANSNMQWDSVVKDFYDDFIPNVNKLNDKALISQSKDERKRCLGTNEDGKSVYVYIAKYGPVIQIGDEFRKLDSEYGINSVTLDDIKQIIKYPKKIGVYQEKDILIKNGMYGYYIYYDDKNYKLLENMDENIDIDDAIKCIINENEKNKDTIKIDKYTIKNGPYGYYILFNKKFYSIPKNYDVNTLTKELCDTIIKIPKKTFKKKT
jgi:DNA topoisomerase-1